MKKRYVNFLVFVFLLVSFFSLFFKLVQFNEEKKIYGLVNSFLYSIQDNEVEYALSKVYFKEENREIYYDLVKEGLEDDFLESYEINSLEKLNDKVYKFNISLNNKYNTAFKPYIVSIKGEWFIVLHHRDILDEFIKDIYIEKNPNEIEYYELIN